VVELKCFESSADINGVIKIIIFEAVIGKEKARDSYKPGGVQKAYMDQVRGIMTCCVFVRSEIPRENFLTRSGK